MVKRFFSCCWQLKKRAVSQLSPNTPAQKEITPCSDLSNSIIISLSRDALFCSGTNTISSMCTRNIKRMKGLPISKQVPGVHVLPGGVGAIQKEMGTEGEWQLLGSCQCFSVGKTLAAPLSGCREDTWAQGWTEARDWAIHFSGAEPGSWRYQKHRLWLEI